MIFFLKKMDSALMIHLTIDFRLFSIFRRICFSFFLSVCAVQFPFFNAHLSGSEIILFLIYFFHSHCSALQYQINDKFFACLLS